MEGNDGSAPERDARETPQPPEAGRPRQPGRLHRLTGAALRWLPAGTRVRVMLAVSFIDSLGTGMFLTGSALFFTREIALTPAQVGWGLSLAGVAGFLASVPLGRLSDRIGAVPMLVAIQFWRAACFFAYPFVDSYKMFLLVACAVGVAEWAAGPVVQSVLGGLLPGGSRVRAMAALTVVRNVGFVIGAGAATMAIALGGASVYRVLVLLDALSFLVSGLLLLRLRGTPAAAPTDRSAASRRQPWPGLRYLLLAVLNGVLYLHHVILTVGLPLWIATHTRGPALLVGAVVLVNTVLAITLQMRLSQGVDDAASAAVRQVRAGVVLALCCLLIAGTGPTAPLLTGILVVAATAALTVAEIYQSVGAWGISFAFAAEAHRGYHLSVYNLGVVTAMIVGPGLVTAVVLPAGAAGWIGLGALIAAAGIAVPALVRGHRMAIPVG